MNADEIVKALERMAPQFQTPGKEVVSGAADLIESLQSQLAESQRREQAAVEDMKHSDNCDICVGSGSEPDSCGCECMTCTLDCRCRDCRDESKFEWRGSQEAGEGGHDTN